MRVRGAAPRRGRGRGAGSAAPVAGGRPPREQPPRAAGRLRCAPQTPRSRCAAAHGAAAPRRSALSTGPWRLRRRAQTRSDFATCSAPGAPCAGAGYGTSRGAAELGGQAAAELTWGRAWRRFARSRPLWGRAAGTSAALSSSTSARRAPPGAPRPRAPLPLNPNLTPWRAPRSHALVLDPAHVCSLVNLGMLHHICHKAPVHAGAPRRHTYIMFFCRLASGSHPCRVVGE